MSYATQTTTHIRRIRKTPDSGIWYIRYRSGGKAVRKRVGTRTAAIEALNKVRLIGITGQGGVAKSAKERTLTQDEIDGRIISA